jgi:hypothetical protein
MFLYYREQNEFACNIFKTVHSITEVLTNMGLCVWENLNHNMIISILLLVLFVLINKKIN